MILPWLFIVPLAGGVISWIFARQSDSAARWVSLLALGVNLVLSVSVWVSNSGQAGFAAVGPWLVEMNVPWIPQLGISFHLAMDGLSLVLVNLTNFVGIMAVLASWREPRERIGFFYLNLMAVLAGIIGVFISLDLFLFYFFWEVMLVPMYFLFLWGHERRFYAGTKFFLFTQLSGLMMLLSILGLYFVHGQATGSYTFDYDQLLGTSAGGALGTWLMLGFFIAFAVKLPVVPFHTWLPDAYEQSPTAGTVVLSALMAKTAGYGLIRFVIPLFPDAAFQFAPVAMTLAVAGILYGALLAYGQRDLKRLIAYSSVSHMGFVLLGVFAWNELALQGVVIEMVAHGISTGALFILAGSIEERLRTREMGRMGGLWTAAPLLGGTSLLFALASLGLPGMGNFVAEFLILAGTFRVSAPFTVFAALGMVAAAVYALWMIQRVFQGRGAPDLRMPDLYPRELGAIAALVLAIFWLGLFPQPVLNATGQALANLQKHAPARALQDRSPVAGVDLGKMLAGTPYSAPRGLPGATPPGGPGGGDR